MYTVTDNGILKRIESWSVNLPLQDNDGIAFDPALVDEILNEILLDYPGFTVVNTVGYWKGPDRVYIDKNYQVVIDSLPDGTAESSKFFISLKADLQQRLHQEKIYITKQDSKEELLSFEEFFSEVGLQWHEDVSKGQAVTVAKQMVGAIDFLVRRLGYETVVLQRDCKNKKILWERKIVGILLQSELEDIYPEEAEIVAADQIAELGAALSSLKPVAIIGTYEFQQFILERANPHCLSEALNVNSQVYRNPYGFSPTGKPLDCKRFVEEFTAAVFTHYVILRDEGFLQREISINVGSDGSMQRTTNPEKSVLLINQAVIPHKEVQQEIIRCLRDAVEMYENNQADPIAVLQAKAKNSYWLERALVRHNLKDLQHQT